MSKKVRRSKPEDDLDTQTAIRNQQMAIRHNHLLTALKLPAGVKLEGTVEQEVTRLKTRVVQQRVEAFVGKTTARAAADIEARARAAADQAGAGAVGAASPPQQLRRHASGTRKKTPSNKRRSTAKTGEEWLAAQKKVKTAPNPRAASAEEREKERAKVREELKVKITEAREKEQMPEAETPYTGRSPVDAQNPKAEPA